MDTMFLKEAIPSLERSQPPTRKIIPSLNTSWYSASTSWRARVWGAAQGGPPRGREPRGAPTAPHRDGLSLSQGTHQALQR